MSRPRDPSSPTTIATETHEPTVVLRPFREEDAAALFPIFADGEAMAYWSTPPHVSIDETQAFVRASMEAAACGEGDDQVVLFKGRVVGKAGLWNNEEIGFIFAREVWGTGVARAAAKAVIARAWARGVSRILADVDPRNARCLALLERLGFRRTGEAKATVQIGGAWADSVFFELVP